MTRHDDSTIMATLSHGQPSTLYWNHWNGTRQPFISDLSRTLASAPQPYYLYLCRLYVWLSGNLAFSRSYQQQFRLSTYLTNRDHFCHFRLSHFLACTQCSLVGFRTFYYWNCFRTDQHFGNVGPDYHYSRPS